MINSIKPQIKSVVFVFIKLFCIFAIRKQILRLTFQESPLLNYKKQEGYLTLIKREKYDRRRTFKRKRILLYFL